MNTKLKLWAFPLAFLMAVACVMPLSAQETTTATELPAVTAPDAERAQGGMMSGDKPYLLMVDEKVGEIEYVFHDETRELETILAKRGVVFSSDDMTLNSDEFEYQTLNSLLIATGKLVVVRLGEIVITSQFFRYNPDTQEGTFSGKPLLWNKDKEGKVTTTGGGEIQVFNSNGKFRMKIMPGSGVPTFARSSGNAAAATPVPKKGETNALIVLDQKPGTVVAPLTAAGSSPTANRLVSIPGQGNSSTSTSGAKAAPKGQVDPDNPADIQSLSN